MAKSKKIAFVLGVAVVLLPVVAVFSCNLIINLSTKKSIYNATDIPSNDVALILGTSKYTSDGRINLFFKYRIEAAVKLYRLGRIKHIIVSGDNNSSAYNEPRKMLQALMELGIPRNAVTLDYAGFRTLDSVIRCKKVFGQDNVTIISQRFHVQRAIFIAKKNHINAYGFAAEDPPKNPYFKTGVREYFAKTKAVIDLYIINKKPKFLGDRVHIAI